MKGGELYGLEKKMGGRGICPGRKKTGGELYGMAKMTEGNCPVGKLSRFFNTEFKTARMTPVIPTLQGRSAELISPVLAEPDRPSHMTGTTLVQQSGALISG